MRKYLRRGALVLASLTLITGCVQASTTSEKPTSSSKPTTSTTQPTIEKTLTAISIAAQPRKTEYELGAQLDLSGAQLKIIYSDGATDTITITNDMIGAVDTSSAGQKIVTVTYEYKGVKKTTTFKITVKEKPVVIPVAVRFAKEMDHIAIGGKLILAPIVSPAGAELAWHSSNDDIATVANGVVTGHAYGNVTISVTQKGSDEVLATTKIYVLRQSAAPVNWAVHKFDNDANPTILTFTSGGTMPNLKQKKYDKIIIDEKVGEDQLTLSGLTADVVDVRGGSATSIILSGCTIGKLAVTKTNESGDKPVRVEIGAETVIEHEIALNSPEAILTIKARNLPTVKVLKETTLQTEETRVERIATTQSLDIPVGLTATVLEIPKKLDYDYGVAGETAIKAESSAEKPNITIAKDVTIERIRNDATDATVEGKESVVSAVETSVNMNLGVTAQLVNTGSSDITIKNTDETPSETTVKTGEKYNYDAADSENTKKIEGLTKVGEYYEVYNRDDLDKAFKDVETSNIRLARDILDHNTLILINNDKKYTLDLNGYTLAFAKGEAAGQKPYQQTEGTEVAQFPISIRAGELTLKGEKEGSIIRFRNEGILIGIRVWDERKGTSTKAGVFNFESGLMEVDDETAARPKPKEEPFTFVQLWGKYGTPVANIKGGKMKWSDNTMSVRGVVATTIAKLVVTGGEIDVGENENGVPISADVLGNTEIDISGGTLKGGVGIYQSRNGKLNISDVNIVSKYDALIAASGDINITGGRFETKATEFDSLDEKTEGELKPDGNKGTNAAITLLGRDKYPGDLNFKLAPEAVINSASGVGIYEHNWRTADTYKTTIDLSGYTKETLQKLKMHVSQPIEMTEGTEKYLAASTDVSLKTAFDEAKDGDNIVLINDIVKNGISIKKPGATITLDLNKREIKSGGAADSGTQRVFILEEGTLNVIGQGKIIAEGAPKEGEAPYGSNPDAGTGAFGTFTVGKDGVLNLKDIELQNNRPWGLNVKVLGGEATLEKVKIISSYGGGIEVTSVDLDDSTSKKGKAVVTDCEFTQTGYNDWCSTALSVSGNSDLTVNGGVYNADGWGLYIFSSGGHIAVNNGTFAGKKGAIRADVDATTYPAYEGSVVVNGGAYTGELNIKEPATLTITGGTFNVDPTAYVDTEKYDVKKDDDKWTVSKKPTA